MKVQVILREQELNEAIRAYIIKEGYPVEGMDISINLIKGRSGFGSTRAEVDLMPAGELAKKEETVSEKIEDIVDDIEEVVEDVIEDIVEDVQETIEDTVDKVVDAYENIKESLFINDDEKKDIAEATKVEEEVSTKSLFG